MIRLEKLTHVFNRTAPVFTEVTLDIPSDRRVALLGAADSGKTTMISLLAGMIAPTAGRIERFARLSYPAGYVRGFRTANTVRQNVEFAAKAYGADPQEVSHFVTTVTGLGADADRPMRDLPLALQRCIGFVLTYALPFDTYLFDNGLGAGVPAFQSLWQELFEARMQTSGAIIATRHIRVAQQLCDCAVVIGGHGMVFYEDIREGIALFDDQSRAAASARVAVADPVSE